MAESREHIFLSRRAASIRKQRGRNDGESNVAGNNGYSQAAIKTAASVVRMDLTTASTKWTNKTRQLRVEKTNRRTPGTTTFVTEARERTEQRRRVFRRCTGLQRHF
jgi:ribosomal protein L39E